MELHNHQKILLKLLEKKGGNLSDMSLRDISEKIGVPNRAQVVVHHLRQLENKGFIRRVEQGVRSFDVLKQPVDDVVYVDLYKATAQCGPDGYFGEDGVLEKIPLASKTFGIASGDDYFLIGTKGDSMKPMIEEGDLVLAKKQQDIENGQIGVVVHDGVPKVKKVLKIGANHGMGYILNSLNNDFENELVDNNTDFRICGLMKGVIKIN